MTLEFRNAEEEDIPEIFAMSRTLILDYEDLTQIDLDKVLAWVHRKIRENIGEYVCVYADGKKAAYYRLTAADGGTELDDLYVLPHFRGKGIGSTILERCIRSSAQPLFLYVFCKNVRAVSLYERTGFSVTRQVSPSRAIMTYQPRRRNGQ